MVIGVDEVKNPYIRAKLAEVLYEMFPHSSPLDTLMEEQSKLPSSSQFYSIFQFNQIALNNLVPALFRLYVDIEQTGSM